MDIVDKFDFGFEGFLREGEEFGTINFDDVVGGFNFKFVELVDFEVNVVFGFKVFDVDEFSIVDLVFDGVPTEETVNFTFEGLVVVDGFTFLVVPTEDIELNRLEVDERLVFGFKVVEDFDFKVLEVFDFMVVGSFDSFGFNVVDVFDFNVLDAFVFNVLDVFVFNVVEVDFTFVGDKDDFEDNDILAEVFGLIVNFEFEVVLFNVFVVVALEVLIPDVLEFFDFDLFWILWLPREVVLGLPLFGFADERTTGFFVVDFPTFELFIVVFLTFTELFKFLFLFVGLFEISFGLLNSRRASAFFVGIIQFQKFNKRIFYE